MAYFMLCESQNSRKAFVGKFFLATKSLRGKKLACDVDKKGFREDMGKQTLKLVALLTVSTTGARKK
jgi:hypothetical protein